MASIYGLMEEYMKEIGQIIRCMEKDYINGKMAEVMKDNIIMIKSMVMEFILGQMVEDMRDIGKMEKDKEKENIYYQQEYVDKEYGIEIKE